MKRLLRCIPLTDGPTKDPRSPWSKEGVGMEEGPFCFRGFRIYDFDDLYEIPINAALLLFFCLSFSFHFLCVLENPYIAYEIFPLGALGKKYVHTSFLVASTHTDIYT